MTVFTVSLVSSHGRIWSQKPKIRSDGLLTQIRGPCEQSKPRAGFTCATFSRSGESFALLDSSGSVFVFHVMKNRFKLVTRAGVKGTCLSFSPRREYELLVAFSDGSVHCYNTETGQLDATLKGHRNPVKFISFHPTGSMCATTSSEVSLLWDASKWRRKRALSGAGDVGVQQASFIGLGDTLLTAFRDDSAILWYSPTFTVKCKLSAPAGEVKMGTRAVAVSTDGRWMALGGKHRVLAIWDLEIQTLMKIIDIPPEAGGISQLGWLAESQTVLVLCDDGLLRFVDIVSCKVISSIGSPRLQIHQFDVSPHGRYLVAVCGEIVQLYDIKVLLRVPKPTTKTGVLGSRALAESGHGAETGESSGLPTAPETLSSSRFFPDHPSHSWTNSAFGCGVSDADIMARILRKRNSSGAKAHRDRKHVEPSPLFKLSHEKGPLVLDFNRLHRLLLVHGEYPERYRLMVWRFLFGLPESTEAYNVLKAKGSHVAFTNLEQQCPIVSRRLFSKLERCLSCLAHWSPIFAESPIIPALAFPFVKLFEQNEQSAFEVVATVIVNYCQNWFEFHPNPPVHVLSAVEELLGYHDRILLDHFQQHQVTSQTYAWTMLQNLFSEVFSSTEWLKVMDHVFSNEPTFLYYLVVAYLRYFRRSLLDVTCLSDYEYFFHRNNAGDINKILHSVYDLIMGTPSKLHPKLQLFEPLVDGYPIFNKYPSFVVEYQSEEHRRIRLANTEFESRRQTLQELEERVAKLSKEEEEWRTQQDQLIQAEAVRRRQAAAVEQEHRARKARLDLESKDQRLKQISIFEESRRAFLQQQRKLKEAELARLEDEILRRKEDIEYEQKARLEEEALLKIEWETMQRISEIEEEREREEAAKALRASLAAREQQDEIEDKVLAEAWKLEDEERRIKQRMAAEQRQKERRINDEMRTRRSIEEKYRLAELEKDFKLMELQRERRLRQLTEDEVERVEAAVETKKQQEMLLEKEEDNELRALADQERIWRDTLAEERKHILERERRKHALQLEVREKKLKELEKRQRLRDFHNALSRKRREERAALLEEEKELQQALAALDQERHKDWQMEQMVFLKEEETQEKLEFQRKAQEAHEIVAAAERKKQSEIREAHRDRMKQDREEAIRQHQVAMTQLKLAHEKELRSSAAEMRKKEDLQGRVAMQREIQEEEQRTVERDAIFRAERLQLGQGVQGASTAHVPVPDRESEESLLQDVSVLNVEALLLQQKENERKLRFLEEEHARLRLQKCSPDSDDNTKWNRGSISSDDVSSIVNGSSTKTSTSFATKGATVHESEVVQGARKDFTPSAVSGAADSSSFDPAHREEYIAELKASAQEVLSKHQAIKKQLTQFMKSDSSMPSDSDQQKD